MLLFIPIFIFTYKCCYSFLSLYWHFILTRRCCYSFLSIYWDISVVVYSSILKCKCCLFLILPLLLTSHLQLGHSIFILVSVSASLFSSTLLPKCVYDPIYNDESISVLCYVMCNVTIRFVQDVFGQKPARWSLSWLTVASLNCSRMMLHNMFSGTGNKIFPL